MAKQALTTAEDCARQIRKSEERKRLTNKQDRLLAIKGQEDISMEEFEQECEDYRRNLQKLYDLVEGALEGCPGGMEFLRTIKVQSETLSGICWGEYRKAYDRAIVNPLYDPESTNSDTRSKHSRQHRLAGGISHAFPIPLRGPQEGEE